MSFPGKILMISLFGMMPMFMPNMAAQSQQTKPQDSTQAGKDLMAEKCYQCHGDSMWKDHRQDRKGWESVLYRMIGRGALWTEEEVRLMSDYLAATYGPPAKQ